MSSIITMGQGNYILIGTYTQTGSKGIYVYGFDEKTGKVLRKTTHQGAANTSAWSRGQAWGLYGYTLMFRYTKNPKYLAQADAIANYILTNKSTVILTKKES